jgi:GTPase SAR1 family protein
VKSPYINLDFKKNEDRPPTTRCIIQRGDKIECQNLLQFIGFDDELRLSLLSNISSPMGIASVTEYPYLIDEFTRVLYYSYTIRQEYLPTDINKIKKRIEQSTSKVDGTHIITGIDSGIDLIVILRLMSADSKTIDDILNKIKQSLINDTILSSDVSVDGILSIHIYSNIQHLTEQKTLINVYKTIRQMKKNFADYRPSNYILHSIEMFIPNNNQSSVTFNLLKPTIVQKIEQYLFQFSWINKIWLTTLDDEKSNILNNNLEEQLREIQKQLSRLNEQYKNEKKQIQQLILSIRYGKDSQKIIEHKILNEDVQTTLKNNIDQLIYSITRFKEKRFFIDDLKRRGFDYQNANKYHIQQNDNENIIQQKLIENNQHLRILCSNDSLNNNNLSTLEQLSFKLLNETKLNPHLRLRYVDFTYSSYELDQIKVFPSSNYRTDPNQRPSLVLAKKETPSIDDNTINILLLGKSGVGKSTLINTFLDHLKFNRFEDIQSNRSSVPILISFLRLIKINSEEHSIRFGNCDRNEDYDHPDQSTTQQCKLYHFNLDNNQKLCIIDTPGFGKTHDQYNDDITMQHILSRIINLTHLNAICILIQSDDIQFDDYQICLTKLFHFFGNNAADNILFCFTKTLSKNLNNDQRNNVIKLMIESLSTSNIHFNEKTIFEFDSTYFINSTISHRFTSSIDTSNQISEESWRISKNGWNRLLNYIRQNLRPYSIQQGLQKAQLARLEINQLIRPLLETIRNNIRNFLLSKTGYSNCSIELHPMSLLHPSAICCSCKRNYRQYGPFWIVSDSPHHFRNYCDTGSCDQHQHIRIDYRLEYQYLSNQTNEQSLTTSISEEDLLYRSVRLAHFLLQEHHNTNNDPFLSYLNKMIDDERSICENISSHRVNIALQNQLINFKQNYQREMNAIKQKHNQNDYDIYDLIENVKQIPMIKIQLDAARKMQETNV